jgi:hypothetical protein
VKTSVFARIFRKPFRSILFDVLDSPELPVHIVAWHQHIPIAGRCSKGRLNLLRLVKRRKACFSAQERLYPCGMSKKSGVIDLAARVRRTSLWAVASSLFARWLKNRTRTCNQTPLAWRKCPKCFWDLPSGSWTAWRHSTRKRRCFSSPSCLELLPDFFEGTRAHALGVTAHFQQRPQPGRLRDAHPAQNGTLPAEPAAVHGSRSDRDCRQAAVNVVFTDLDRLG